MNKHTARLTHNARLAGMALSDVGVRCECAHGAGECRLHPLAECGSVGSCEACAEDAHDAD